MRLAIMQPYLLPYIGYFQLINASDKFVFYDDVAYIRQGWINRNRINMNGEARFFSVPVNDASSFRPIRETTIAHRQYLVWRKKFFSSIDTYYRRALFYEDIRSILESIFVDDAGSIGELAKICLRTISSYLELKTVFVDTSSIYTNSHLTKAERLIDICRIEGSDTYINPIGGVDLYAKEEFEPHGISLYFLRTLPISYPQAANKPFVDKLSIIDMLMCAPRDAVKRLLNQYELE